MFMHSVNAHNGIDCLCDVKHIISLQLRLVKKCDVRRTR